MAFGPANNRDRHLAEINVVPLIDVMLVLLVIFIVTAPLLTHAVKIDLPKVSADAGQPPEHVQLAIREQGELFWNGESVTGNELELKMRGAASRNPVPELRIHADRLTPYEHVARVVAMASRSGLSRFAFVSVPDA